MTIDNNAFQQIYGNDEKQLKLQQERYETLYSRFRSAFNNTEPECFVSAPGRTEISGNHTDHNAGKVIAASINLDTVACVGKADGIVELISDGYDGTFNIDLNELEIIESEKETTTALIKGVLVGFKNYGFNIGGFKCSVTSDVLQGSGLSSSASFEVLIGAILNFLYNNASIEATKIAQIGQYAENEYFGKPCGLMDQVACATGSIVSIDFKSSEDPIIEKINFDLSEFGYKLIVLDTGGSHANLTNEYAAIPTEMKTIAKYFDKSVCREIDYQDFKASISELKDKISQRAILRAFHFYNENIRVGKQVEALKEKDFNQFLLQVKASGNSSYKYLQNINVPSDTEHQPVGLALALTEEFLENNKAGACRIHGGGFAGTIQIFMPENLVQNYIDFITPIFGESSVTVLDIRQYGTYKIEIMEK